MKYNKYITRSIETVMTATMAQVTHTRQQEGVSA